MSACNWFIQFEIIITLVIYCKMVQHELPIVVSRLFNYRTLNKRAPILRLISRIPIIQPDSYFWIVWRVILTCYIIFFLFDITLLLAFGSEFWHDETDIVALKVFYFIGVAFIGVDVFLEFHVGYYQGGILHKNRKDIFEKKAILVLTIDVLTLIILVLSFFIYNWILSVLKIIFFLKLFRLRGIDRQFQDLCLLHRRLRLFYEVVKITLIFVLYCHVIGCIFYGVDLILFTYNPYYVQNQYLWILNCPAFPNLVAQPWNIKYLYAAYWAVTSTATVGYGDIYPKNPIGNLLIVLSNISICIMFGIFARSVITAFQNYNKINSNLKEQIRLLKEYVKIKRISKDLGRRIRRFIEFKALLEGLKQESKIEEFKSKLSPQIQRKLCYIMYKPFLSNLPLIRDQSELMQLSTLIKQQNFFEGQVLNLGNQQRILYYIKEGYVSEFYQLMSSTYQTIVLPSKNKFRLLEYFTGFSSRRSYKFLTHAQILTLEGPPIMNSQLQREQYQQFKMELVVYQNSQGLGIFCSICQQNHLEHHCKKMFPQKKHRLSGNQNAQNPRIFKPRKGQKQRIIDEVGNRRVWEPASIDRVCNFHKYYTHYNILI